MRRPIALAAAILFGSATAVLAETADGTVTEIDEDAQTITLDSGDTIYLPDENDFTELKANTRVTVVYEEENGQKVAESVVIQEAESMQ